MNKIELTIGAVFSLAITGAALAHGGATGIVKERMDGMMAMGKAVKSLSSMMRGDVDYDEAAVKSHAQTIEAHGGEALVSLFPEGSDGAPSEAKPEIWSEPAEFEALATQLKTYAVALQAAAPNGLMMQEQDQTDMMGGSGMMSGSSMMESSDMMGNDVCHQRLWNSLG
jgi:cytochrome c556